MHFDTSTTYIILLISISDCSISTTNSEIFETQTERSDQTVKYNKKTDKDRKKKTARYRKLDSKRNLSL